MSIIDAGDATRIHERLSQTPLPGETRENLTRATVNDLNEAIGTLTAYALRLKPQAPQLRSLVEAVRHGYHELVRVMVVAEATKKPRNHCSECSRKLQNDEPVVHNKSTHDLTCLNCHLRIEGQLTVLQQVQLLEIKNDNREIIRSGTHEAPNEPHEL